MKVLIIGAGNMGKSYAESFINASAISRNDLFFLERHTEKGEAVQHLTNHSPITQANESIGKVDLIILSVKPQDFAVLSEAIKPFVRPEQLVLSIMAGIKVETIQAKLGTEKVVRCMPNLPAQVGLGMTVFTTSDAVSRIDIFAVQNLLNTTGKTLYTPDERMIDASTAISGSGPAFVFYFMNAMMQAGKTFGFSDSEAKLLVEQTFLGSVNLLHRNSLHCEEWIQKVASRGGTTEAALKFFGSNQFDEMIKGGLNAAFNRARELSES